MQDIWTILEERTRAWGALGRQVVSEHLHGKMRGGQAVGGALRNLRKE